MPELPDIVAYIAALEPRIVGAPLERVRLTSPFLLRSVDPPLSAVEGRVVRALRRIGKRIVWEFDEELFVVLHLMIAGRLRWRETGASPPRKVGLAAFDFPTGVLTFTEAGSKKRASLYVVRGEAALAAHDRRGLDILGASLPAFRVAILSENHTLKRTLTDPRLLDGVGNAYWDEILHAARLSPTKLTQRLTPEEIDRLYVASQRVLTFWIDKLRAEAAGAFPEKVTAFREEMAVHGRFGKPCPICGAPVQRIVHADNEVNYCAVCQTEGRLLADRALSRLLREDWPASLDELDEHRRTRREPLTDE